MTNYRAILDYYYKGNTTSQTARICECSRTTVLKTIKRAKECGIELPLTYQISDMQLLKTLYPKRVHREEYTQPDFYALEKDKKKRRLTIFVMWRRYYKRTLAAGGKPYGKSQFFKMFRQYLKVFQHDYQFKMTATMKKAYSFFYSESYPKNKMPPRDEVWSRFVSWCKKMRLNPLKL